MPGQRGQATVVTFTLLRRGASYRNEVGLFLVDDASGRVSTLRPGDLGYAVAALGRRMVLFDRGQKRGATKEIVLPAGSFFGTYLIANSTSGSLPRRNPSNRPAGRHLPISPSGRPILTAIPHVLRRPSENILRMEDQWGGGDRDHDDAVIRLRFHAQASDDTPPPAPTGLDLVASSDTGRSDHDDITSDRTPTLRANAEAGALVRFYVDGSLAGEARANSPWSGRAARWAMASIASPPRRRTRPAT